MDTVLYLVFRRMRRPLVTLIVAYAIAVFGLTLIPGEDGSGNVWHMSIFHAFYFVSYMATTIGFGEIPHAFNDAQRMWVIFSLYGTVIVWIYAIGTLLQLIQNPAFQQAVTEKRFAKNIRSRTDPFYLICGYGETGSELVKSLIDHNRHAVVLDINQDRVNELELQNLREYVPSLCADARRPVHLVEAGLKHPQCNGVVAVTNDNEANLKIAITSKLLNPRLQVISRADSHDFEANMASFGTDRIIDPYDTFGVLLATALQAPCLYLLHQWLTGMSDEKLGEPVYPPNHGKWIICGFGRFGKAVYHRLKQEGMDIVVVEMQPQLTGKPDTQFVEGRGTEADTLLSADIESAVGLVAGTDNDANNLSIIVTALELNPEIFTISRKNEKDNDELFDALHCNMVMNPGNIIANKIRALLAAPMLYEFLGLATYQDEIWACELVSRISGAIHDVVPDIWEIEINAESAYSVLLMQKQGHRVTLGNIISDRHDRELPLNLVALLYMGYEGKTLLPDNETVLHEGDRLLFCGRTGERHNMEWNLQNLNVLEYQVTGEVVQHNPVVRFLRRQ